MRGRIAALGILMLSVAGSSLGQVAEFVKDLDPGWDRALLPFSIAGPRKVRPIGGRVVFLSNYDLGQTGLWSSDGTPEGTLMLDATPLGRFFGVTGGRYLFRQSDEGDFGFRLWASDGTVGGAELLSETADVVSVEGTIFAGVDREADLYFIGCHDGCRLWRTDGTRAGTGTVPGSVLVSVTSLGGWLVGNATGIFFQGDDGSGNEVGLWHFDGRDFTHLATLGDTRISPDQIITTADRVYFSTFPGNLWVSDGTPEGTAQFFDFPMPDGAVYLSTFGAAGSNFVAGVVESPASRGVWVSDGTVDGTRRVLDLAGRVVYNGFFAEGDGFAVFSLLGVGTGDRELWLSDGTEAGTRRLLDLCDDCRSSTLRFEELGGKVYVLLAGTGASGLWSVVGPDAAASAIPIPPFPAASWLNPVDGGLFFAASTTAEPTAYELWRLDPDTQLLRRLTALTASGASLGIRPDVAMLGERLFFIAHDPRHGAELWSSLGDRGTERLLTDSYRDPDDSLPRDAVRVQDRAVLLGREQVWSTGGTEESTVVILDRDAESVVATDAGAFIHSDRDLWRSDGTVEGTRKIFTLPEEARFGGTGAAYAGGYVFALVEDGAAALWLADDHGATPVLPLPGTLLRGHQLTALGGRLYFETFSPDTERSFWSSDLTEIGTELLFTSESRMDVFAEVGGVVVVTSFAGGPIWRTDGSADGTSEVIVDGEFGRRAAFTVFGDRVLALGSNDFGRRALWSIDPALGTAGLIRSFASPRWAPGTQPLSAGKVLVGSVFEPQIVSTGELAYFAAATDSAGQELWVSDGSAAGTLLVRDIAPGAASSYPEQLFVLGDEILLRMRTEHHGWELWRSDGTAAGTRLVHDIAPGPASSEPGEFFRLGDDVLFSATDGLRGRELWRLPPAGVESCRVTETTLCLRDRFRAELFWRGLDDRGAVAKATPLTDDTGTFYFADSDNIEVVTKILDGRALNDHFWWFLGGLSDVDYDLTLTDTATGATRRYSSPEGTLTSRGEITAFGPRGSSDQSFFPPRIAEQGSGASVVRGTGRGAVSGSCEPTDHRLCLSQGRFAVEVTWRDFEDRSGTATAVHLTDDTGYFWFFRDSNVETMVKVLDGRPINGAHWVFYGALSNVEYRLTVTDTETGEVKTYFNPLGEFGSLGDTNAFRE